MSAYQKRFTIRVEGYGGLWMTLADDKRHGRESYFDIAPNGSACLVLDWDEKTSTITLLAPDKMRVVAGSLEQARERRGQGGGMSASYTSLTDLASEILFRDPLLPSWVDVGTTSVCGGFVMLLRTTNHHALRMGAWAYHVGVISERDLEPCWSNAHALVELLDVRYRELRARLFMQLSIQFPLWWCGESVLDPDPSDPTVE